MNTGVAAEEYVKKWCKKNNREHKKGRSKGYDLIMLDEKGEEIFVEVKGSTKEEFKEVRPYIRLEQLKMAVEKGKNYEFHILLGFKDVKPKEHRIFSGQDLIKYKKFIDEAVEFQKKWSNKNNEMSKILWPEVEVYLKENIGKKADAYINSQR